MKILIGVHPDALSNFLKGEAVAFYSHKHTSLYVCIECDPDEIYYRGGTRESESSQEARKR